MINRPADWDTATAEIGGGGGRLPLANYICYIVAAGPYTSKKGNEMLRIAWDVAEGEYKDFYNKKFNADKKNYGKEAKWKSAGIYYISLGEGSTGRLKGFAKCLEDSNPGYHWDFDDTKLGGLKFAGQMSGENKSYNGHAYLEVKLANVYPVGSFDEMPDAFMREGNQNGGQNDNPFAEGSNIPDSDIPF